MKYETVFKIFHNFRRSSGGLGPPLLNQETESSATAIVQIAGHHANKYSYYNTSSTYILKIEGLY